MNTLRMAMRIAKKAHRGQKRRNGEPYYNHPFRVAMKMKEDDLAAIAFLHDVVEDCPGIKMRHIKRIFPARIWKGVDAMTHRTFESWDEYIDRLWKNKDARIVKQRDIEDNIGDCKPEKINKYRYAIQVLGNPFHKKITHL